MSLVTRDEWGAEPSKNVKPMAYDPVGIGVYWDERVNDCQEHLRSRQKDDMRRWADIRFSWAVCSEGNVYECRGWGVRTAGNKPKSRNNEYHTVLLMGEITEDMKKALDDLKKDGKGKLISFEESLSTNKLKPAPKKKAPEPKEEEPTPVESSDPVVVAADDEENINE